MVAVQKRESQFHSFLYKQVYLKVRKKNTQRTLDGENFKKRSPKQTVCLQGAREGAVV